MLSNIKESEKSNKIFKTSEKTAFFVILTLSLLLLASQDVVFFHSAVENLGVVVSLCILLISVHTYKISQDKNFNYIGLTYGFAAIFEFAQALYPPDSSISLQLSLCARVFQCLLIIYFRGNKTHKLNIKFILYLYSAITLILLSSIYLLNIVPNHQILNGTFSTSYTISCYFTILLFGFAIFSLTENKHQKNHEVKKLLLAYSVLMIIYQFSILISIPGTNDHIIVIHLIKLACNYPMFKLVTNLALKEPIKLFFSDLSIMNEQLLEKERLLKRQNHELVIKNKALVNANSIIINSNQKYKQLLNFLPDAVLLLKGTKIVFTNNNYLKMFGSTNDGSILNSDILDLIPQTHKNILMTQLNEVYSGKDTPSKQGKFNLNSEKTHEVEYVILHNILDNENYALIIFEDVTEKRRANELLAKARIDEENEQLKIGFLANISHELRTPINLIYSALQLEDQYIMNGRTSDIQRYNKVIKQNCFRLLRIINNLIDATKIDASFFKPNMKYMNIISAIENCTLSVVPFIESKSMSLVFDTDIEEKYMFFDPDLIERIVLNLLANSVKYGVYEGTIYVTIKDCEDYLNIYFKDNGVGIPKEKVDLLFNRFVRIDKSFSRNTEGSGIGLYLVKRFVEMHGGYISVKSEAGEGVEFCISLPYSKEKEVSFEEIKLVAADLAENPNIIDKVNIEFSDIYME